MKISTKPIGFHHKYLSTFHDPSHPETFSHSTVSLSQPLKFFPRVQPVLQQFTEYACRTATIPEGSRDWGAGISVFLDLSLCFSRPICKTGDHCSFVVNPLRTRDEKCWTNTRKRNNRGDPQHPLILFNQNRALPSQNQQGFGSEDAAEQRQS